MSQESKTPRTDVHVEEVFNCDDELVRVVNVNFARQLELELAAVTEERDAFIASARIKEANAGWRPIETAPRDGSLVILAGGEMQRPIFAWWTSRGYWAGDQRGPYEPVPYAAAFWMPLPAPPTTEPGQ